MSYLITRTNKTNSIVEILKHVMVAAVVIALSHYVGSLIAARF